MNVEMKSLRVFYVKFRCLWMQTNKFVGFICKNEQKFAVWILMQINEFVLLNFVVWLLGCSSAYA